MNETAIFFKRFLIAIYATTLLIPAWSDAGDAGNAAVAANRAPAGKVGTALSDTAAAMSPGDWVELPTIGISGALLDQGQGGVANILPYADKLHWDPITSRIYFMNSDDPGDGRRFVAYDEASNQWLVLPDPWAGSGVAHQYGLVDINVSGRRIYSIMPDSTSGSYFDLTTNQFVGMTMPSGAYSCCGAIAYFPERNSLVFAHGSTLRERHDATGQWSTLSSSINTTYHAIAHYNSTHKIVIFGGGNDSSRSFYKVDQNGVVTALRQPPINLHSPRVEIVENPITGKFMVFGVNQQLYSYDPVMDSWTTLSSADVPSMVWAGQEFGANLLTMVATAIPRYGVTVLVSCRIGGSCGVHLYKYASAPAAPNAPQSLTVS